jgi:hypothetical protein
MSIKYKDNNEWLFTRYTGNLYDKEKEVNVDHKNVEESPLRDGQGH